jgi:hypothetical protein
VAVSAVLAAGTYYVAGDGQTTDFLYELCLKMNAAIDAVGGDTATVEVIADIHPTTHKVRLQFKDAVDGGALLNDVKLAWTESDGDDVAKVLGFAYAADDTSTADDDPIFTGDYQHGYGWYADEDGLLADLPVEDYTSFSGLQARALSGRVKTQQLVDSYSETQISFQQISRAKMFSRNIGYGVAAVYPYAQNVGLECWWVEARKGTQFRVYRDGNIDTSRAGVQGASTASNTTTLTDAGRAWATDPQIWAGGILHKAKFGAAATYLTQNFYISSHTATVITVPAATPSGLNISNNETAYYLFDFRYQTYVVDLDDFKKFQPKELPAIDKYDLEVALLRFV